MDRPEVSNPIVYYSIWRRIDSTITVSSFPLPFSCKQTREFEKDYIPIHQLQDPDVSGINQVREDRNKKVGLEFGNDKQNYKISRLYMNTHARSNISKSIENRAAEDKSVQDLKYKKNIIKSSNTRDNEDFEVVIGYIPAIQDSTYDCVAPTLVDSLEVTGIQWSIFKVCAHTEIPSIFYFSLPDSGYSIDNLAPSTPTGLMFANDEELIWDSCPDEDFQYFSVYYGENSGEYNEEPFTTTIDTFWVDDFQEGYYVVTATDFAGNDSDFSDEVSLGPLAFDISGNIGYFSDDEPIPNVILDLTGDNNYSIITNESGDYLFIDIPGGNYISTPSKADNLGGLSGMDASRIARYAALLYELDCLEMITADVSMNGNISGLDASRVARYVALLITELNPEGIDWVFTPEPISECPDWPPIVYENTREYTPLNSDLTNEDFIGIRLGDVSGNWSPGLQGRLTESPAELTEIDAEVNSTLSIPIVIEEVTAIEGIDISIEFEAEVLKLTELSINEGILHNENYAVETNLTETGKGTMVIYAQKNLVLGPGVVAFIEFDVIGIEGSQTEVFFTKFDVNETEASGGLRVVDFEGNEILTRRLEVNVVQTLPEKFAFYPNYPNPFRASTTIKYDLPEATNVTLQIYNIRGQLVEELVNGIETAGRKKIVWNAEGLANGIYFYKLSTKGGSSSGGKAGNKTFIKKTILLK